MRRSRTLIAAGIIALAFPSVAHAAPSSSPSAEPAASPPASSAAGRFAAAPSSGRIDSSVLPRSLDDQSTVDVMVELTGDPVAVVEAKAKKELTSGQAAGVRARLKQQQDAVAGTIKRDGGAVRSTMQSAYNGMRVTVKRNKVPQLAQLSAVAGVHAVQVQTRNNAVSVPFLGVPQVWKNTGYTGKNVKVAIIDTGIDYTHADFGGPGTKAAYEKAKASSTQKADPALFGPNAPRVKGGWDFVGDDYDGAKPNSVPKPDPNPLDCEGHGSHVAGSAAGGGVTEDGKAYTGPYDASTATKQWKVGPGAAPQADLYALRVFGCSGSTEVTTEAIDWAVQHRMDVINMSLGSPFGRVNDPTSVAATNAVAAGVVVIASAGNSGPNPYLTGAPGAGRGVVSVAATDSSETFPGAKISLPGGSAVDAINANGATLPGGPLRVVVLADDPATPENEALGCSEEAYTKAGITKAAGAPAQIAVSQRGSCARVAKAIFAQKAGADAALMINNADIYPPYEGPIASNPDTGEAYEVTIPLLGVKASDGPTVNAAAGQQVTLAASRLANPGFRGFGSFSSGGPRSGDSGLKPGVSAPGVSIASASVGTGTDAQYLSGTSMAAPHVAGIAALTVQAHRGWTASDVAAALVSTADPAKVSGYRLTLGGAGLVDTAQSVGTKVVATGDTYVSGTESYKEPSLSFGLAEFNGTFRGTKTVTLVNHGTQAMTFRAAQEASRQSRPARLSFSPASVRVPAGGQATVRVTLTARSRDVGSAVDENDPFGFHEVSGSVRLTSGSTVLRVPYLLVSRAAANITATPIGQLRSSGQTRVAVANAGGALAAGADVYTWGLTDPANDVDPKSTGSGFDLRAAGVQAADVGGKKMLVFAVTMHDRFSNAASNEYDVSIDTNGDSKPDYVVFAADSGQIRAGDANGLSEVFIKEVATNRMAASGYLTVAPTDGSTVLLPVKAADLGLTQSKGDFSYQVSSYSLEGPFSDEIAGAARYNPWKKALSDGQYLTVGVNRVVPVTLRADAANWRAQRPLGAMVVALDNRSGAKEATLIRGR